MKPILAIPARSASFNHGPSISTKLYKTIILLHTSIYTFLCSDTLIRLDYQYHSISFLISFLIYIYISFLISFLISFHIYPVRLPNLQRSCRHLAVSGATGMDSDCTRRHGGQNFTTRSNAWVGWSDDPKLRGWYPSMVFSWSKALIKRDLDSRTGIRFTKFSDNGHIWLYPL
jgi:hypothetical protein